MGIICPYCLNEVEPVFIKKWQFHIFVVTRYECPKCHEKFNAYERDGKLDFTLPGTPKP
jgi:transcriptional regulator NrdR family protein